MKAVTENLPQVSVMVPGGLPAIFGVPWLIEALSQSLLLLSHGHPVPLRAFVWHFPLRVGLFF